MTKQVLNLAERDAIRAERRRRAVQALGERLTVYARERGGRYLLYGSAARGEVRASSDVDILVDFPSVRRAEALLFAEHICAELGLRGDVRGVETASARLLARAEAEGRVLA